jgi:hypothetical protein
MHHRHLAIVLLLVSASAAYAQKIDDMNIQVHGYATQSFLYSDHNNWNTTQSSDGSAAWTEAVVNLSAEPQSRLRIGIQGRYSLLGSMGNEITLDWAQADFKVNEYFGIRAGKLKTPFGLFNETQDIDPAHLWVLLPQSFYPIASRDANLSEYGGEVYGNAHLGESMGKIEYRAYGGDRVIPTNDGYFQQYRDQGVTAPNGLTLRTTGGLLRWTTPVKELSVGASETSGSGSAALALGPLQGTVVIPNYRETAYFAKYERGRWLLASELGRLIILSDAAFPGIPDNVVHVDERPWYVMATCKITPKLSGGAYYSSIVEHQGSSGSSGYEKDWTVATRYDFNPFLYLKGEQHWVNGTLIGFSTSDNTDLQPKTRMTLLKLGVSF